jgi:hypothetical protein
VQRRRVPHDTAVQLGHVEQWLRRQQAGIERRAAGLALREAGRSAAMAGRGAGVIGRRIDAAGEATAAGVVEVGSETARRFGPLGPIVDDAANVIASGVRAWGDGVRRWSEVEDAALTAAGRRLERAGTSRLRALR